MKYFVVVMTVAAMSFFHSGCVSSRWDGRVSRWGTLREVLRDGQSQGRVRLADFSNKPHAYGLGALENLTGEILIHNGRVWVSKCENSQKLKTSNHPANETRATLLAVSYVPSWKKIRVDQSITDEQFDHWILEVANQHGLSSHEVFPFMVTGNFQHLSVHVLSGQCPVAAAQSGESTNHQPYRNQWYDINATLVGFYGKDLAGILTHHDSSTHVHALIEDDLKIIGHVDALELKAGSILYLPDLQSNN